MFELLRKLFAVAPVPSAGQVFRCANNGDLIAIHSVRTMRDGSVMVTYADVDRWDMARPAMGQDACLTQWNWMVKKYRLELVDGHVPPTARLRNPIPQPDPQR